MALSFIDELPPGTADALLAGSRNVVIERGSWLFHEGDPSHDAFLVTDGIVKILKVAPDGTQALLAMRCTGALIGELSLMSDTDRTAGALAAVTSHFLAVRQERILELMDTDPIVARTIIRTLSNRLDEASSHILELAGRDVAELVARRILELAVAPGFRAVRRGTEPIHIQLPLSQHELGAWAGVSPRAAAGAIGKMRERGIIETARMEMTILDLEGLRQQAGVSSTARV